MDKKIVVQLNASFEDMVQKDPHTGTEFWCARDLQMLLGYSQWRNFGTVIDKAITACQNAGYDPRDHFAHVSKMVDRGIVPEALPPAEDVKKVERRLKSEQKKLPKDVEPLDSFDEKIE